MSAHWIQRKLELATKSYLTTEVPTAPTIRTTEDADTSFEAQNTYVLCPRAEGLIGIPGNQECVLTIELRTMLLLYGTRATAVSAHYAMFGLIGDAMMQDDLATSLAANGTELGINGIHDAADYAHFNRDGVLISSITRRISTAPSTLTA